MAPKSAPAKSKEPHPADLVKPAADSAWNQERLPATFEWDFPARLFPSRRDGQSELHSNAMDRHLLEAIRESYGQSTPGSPTETMVRSMEAFHQEYGGFLHHNLEANRVEVSCGRGCSQCCHHFVTSVHALEILCLYESLRLRPDLETLIEACRARTADFDGWMEFCQETYPKESVSRREDLALEHYYDERNPCPFLASDGACGVYDQRPLTCRMYLATSPVRFCQPENVTHPKADIFTVPADESIAERMQRLDRAVDFWGHSPDLFRSLVRLHDWRRRWLTGPA